MTKRILSQRNTIRVADFLRDNKPSLDGKTLQEIVMSVRAGCGLSEDDCGNKSLHRLIREREIAYVSKFAHGTGGNIPRRYLDALATQLLSIAAATEAELTQGFTELCQERNLITDGCEDLFNG
ncbi:MAG: hypothetical protein KOO60_07230 [Gemmatimonadales bacterium]|nr:hypothetical protein [Gemmatimonadales bacterium]